MDPFLLFMLHVYLLFCLVCSLQPCEYLGKGPGLTSLLSCVLCFTFPYGVPGQVSIPDLCLSLYFVCFLNFLQLNQERLGIKLIKTL